MLYIKKFNQILDSQKNKKQKLFIVSASIITLVASGGGTTTPQPKDGLVAKGDVTGDVSNGNDSVKLGENTGEGGIVDTGAGDDVIVGGDAVDTIRGGAGKDNMQGGAGKDNFVMIGKTENGTYTLSDLQNPNGTGVDLTGLLDLDDVNNNAQSDAQVGEVIDGGADGAILFVYGEVDFTGITLINITRIDVHSELTIPASTLKFLIDSGILEEIVGDGSTELIITNDGTDIMLDLSAIAMSGINHLSLADGVTLLADAADIADTTIIDGEGSIKATSGRLDLDGKTIAETVDILDSDGNIVTPIAAAFSLGSTASVAENTTTVGSFQTTDASSVGIVTYSLDGADKAAFTIDQFGVVKFNNAPDFEQAADVGSDGIYNITITAMDEHGKSLSQDVAITVTDANDVPTGEVTISGDNMENETLVASHNLADQDGLGTVSYQWQRDGVDIDGATANFFTLGQIDVGKIISAVANYTDGGGAQESVSGSVAAIINVNDEPTGGIEINGTRMVGQTLTVVNDIADQDGLGEFHYQWMRDEEPIAGATNATYVLVEDDIDDREMEPKLLKDNEGDYKISVELTYTDGGGTDERFWTNAGEVVAFDNPPTGSVSISGTAEQGQTLTINQDLADLDGIEEIYYAWRRDGSAIEHNGGTYTLTQEDVGADMSVSVYMYDDLGNEYEYSSNVIADIANVNDAPTGTLSILGNAETRGTLSIFNYISDLDGVGQMSFQWLLNDTPISGATENTYTIVDGDLGGSIKLRGTYTDGYQTVEVVTSDGTDTIVVGNYLPEGTVTITGTAAEDETLTATNNLTDVDGIGAITYQWLRGSNEIDGANSDTYTLGQIDVGELITVQARYTDGLGTEENPSSAPTAQVANVNDPVVGTLALYGALRVGELLTPLANLSDDDGIGQVYYVWYRDGVAINAPTTVNTYRLTEADIGKQISVELSYTDGEDTMESITSVPSNPVTGLDVFRLSDVNGNNGTRFYDSDSFVNYIADSVTGLGDINNDGLDDFAIAAHKASQFGSASGSVFVLFGTNSGYGSSFDLENLSGANGFRVVGAKYNDELGWDVSAAGDINNDGYADFMVSSLLADYGGTNTGSVYVIFGKASGYIPEFQLGITGGQDGINGTNGFRIDGPATNTDFGYSISAAGDVNGDGFDDIIIGAKAANFTGQNGSGASYVVFGKGTAFSTTMNVNSLDGTNGFRIVDSTIYEATGYSVSGLGDINNDGYDDLIIGAPYASTNATQNGAAYVVFGQAGGFSANLDLTSMSISQGFRLDGKYRFDQTGVSVSSAGDVNGDGYDDIIIGADDTDHNGVHSGSAYIVFGKAGGYSATIDLESLNGSDGFRIDGTGNLNPNISTFGNSVGANVSSAGDINGDGYADLLVGSNFSNFNSTNSGSSYVIYGHAGDFAANMLTSELDGTNGFRIDGSYNYYMGKANGAVGDINGDGFDDIIVGSSSISPRGEAYILYGGDQFFVSAQVATPNNDTLYGTNGADNLSGGAGLDSLFGMAGNDTLVGGDDTHRDKLKGGLDADTLYGGDGLDEFIFAAGDSKITITGTGDAGSVSGYDVIKDFALSESFSYSETIQYVGIGRVVDDSAGADGTDSVLTIDGATIKSHSITNGIITFDDDDVFSAALAIETEGEYTAVLQYLQNQDFGYAGSSVAFDVNNDNFLFIQGDDDGQDNLDLVILLENTEIVGLIDENNYSTAELFIA